MTFKLIDKIITYGLFSALGVCIVCGFLDLIIH